MGLGNKLCGKRKALGAWGEEGNANTSGRMGMWDRKGKARERCAPRRESALGPGPKGFNGGDFRGGPRGRAQCNI